MSKPTSRSLTVQGRVVGLVSTGDEDYFSLTDIARHRNAEHTDDLIRNWLRNRNTLEFLGIWERLNNPGFNPVEFDGIRMQAGLNTFALTPKQWIERLLTDAIQEHLIPPELTKAQVQFVYASEADLLNVALFGKTAAEWRRENPKQPGNMRDHATLEQLVVLSNLESLNSVLIHQELPAPDRLRQLNAVAIVQVRSLLTSPTVKRLAPGKKT